MISIVTKNLYLFNEISDQLNEIQKATWAGVLCGNTGIEKVPRKAFMKISNENPLVSCSSIPIAKIVY